MNEGLAGWLTAAGFDRGRYVTENTDLLRAGLRPDDAIGHFLAHGHAEDRVLRLDALPAGLPAFAALSAAERGDVRGICRGIYRAQLINPASSDFLWAGGDKSLDSFLTRAGARRFYVLGDSHAVLYRRFPGAGKSWWAPIPLICGAGSAAGLANQASRSGYGGRILGWAGRHAKSRHRAAPVFLKFGQVDAEFVWTFQRIQAGQARFSQPAFEVFTHRTIGRYLGFLQELADALGQDCLRVCSIFPPCLSDAAWTAGYVNAHVGELEGDRSLDALAAGVRAIEIPDLRTRTRMHALFNTHLQDGCARLGLRFVDDFHPFLGPDGVVDPAFAHGGDHHLDYEATRAVCERVIVRELG